MFLDTAAHPQTLLVGVENPDRGHSFESLPCPYHVSRAPEW
jgi:hypothetical protein